MSGNGHALLSIAEMYQADALAVKHGVPSLTLMENAGRALADAAMQLAPAGGRIAVVCGPGNNGGDGYVAARYLRAAGYHVDVVSLVAVASLKGDAAEMARRWQGPVAVETWPDVLAEPPSVIIDAIFGAGLSRAPEGHFAAAIDRIRHLRARGARVLAVDVPSGISGDSGAPLGEHVVGADKTITFFRRKPGHLLMPGRELCGPVAVADIGIPADVLSETGDRAADGGDAITCLTFANHEHAPWRQWYPRPVTDSHKYTRGHAIVVSGPPEMTGAARLGARGALRAGAGLVTVATSRAAFPVNAAHLTAIMLAPFEPPGGLATVLEDKRRNAVLIGPGATVGKATREMVAIAVKSGAAVVLDADALTSFAPTIAAEQTSGAGGEGSFGFIPRASAADTTKPSDLFALIQAAQAPDALRRTAVAPSYIGMSHIVITPHEGEFKRLFPELAGSKLERARAAAKLSGAIVVLKGPDTVIAAPDGRAAINDNAPPWLATAGSGDVLAGFVTGLLAQGVPGFEAACAAVWLHGASAHAFGPGLIAEDIPEILPGVLRGLAALSSSVR